MPRPRLPNATRRLVLAVCLGASPFRAPHAQDGRHPLLQYGDPRNGNVYAAFLDLELAGGAAPRIYRAYQSLSPFCGLFGCGWSSDYETYLAVEGDGSVVVHEWGGGTATPYRASSASARNLDEMVAQIATAARASHLVAADSLIAYQSLLRDNASFRATEWKRLVRLGKVTPPEVNVGTHLRAITPFGIDDLERTSTGYLRTLADGTRQTFDADGRLTKVDLANGHWLALARDGAHRLAAIRDDAGRSIALTLDSAGRVLRATSAERYAAYKYDARGDLVYTRDADGIVITHAYDRWHYLTKIANADGSVVDVAYYPVSMNARVRRVSNEKGVRAEYAYRWTRVDSLEYVVTIALVAPARAAASASGSTGAIARGAVSTGDTISREEYRYEERRRSNGERWMYRIAETIDGRLEATTYDEECGVPIVTVKGSDSTTRTLDARCRVSTRTSGASADSMDYDAQDRVIFFASHPATGGERLEARYNYGADGRLTSMSDGVDAVQLTFDGSGHLLRVQGSREQLAISRDSTGRPVTIMHSRAGAVSIAYASDGSASVTSTPGTDRDALRAYTRRLAALLAPAGVELDF